MNIKQAKINRQAELFENQMEQDSAQKVMDDAVKRFKSAAYYMENLKAEERRMRG
jgi:hypothetical protein